MESESTTTIFSTTTVTSTKTLTRTIISATSILPMANSVNSPAAANHSHASLYEYNPSLPLAIVFTILYFLTTIHHGYLTFHLPTRPETVNKHRYTIPIFIASLLSTLGYLTRCISIQKQHTSDLSLYTTSKSLIIIAPIFFCATLYILLTRLITRCLPPPTVPTPTRMSHHQTSSTHQSSNALQRFLYLPPALLSFLFLASDTLSFLTQLIGAALTASTDDNETQLTRGIHIILAGLALQLSTFLLYLFTLHLFCRRVRTSPTHGFNPCIMKVVTALWTSSGFILLRTVFRLVEFAQGPDGYTFTHEWTLYVFEAFPVWVAIFVMGWWHPIKWIQERALAAAYDMVPRKGRDASGAAGQGTGNSDRDGHVRRRSRAGFVM